MQYAGDAVGLLVWVVIVLISIIYRAVKASGGSAAMPPRQNNTPLPNRQKQMARGEVPRPMPTAPRPTSVGLNGAPLSQQELERAHQALQSELERVFAQGQPTPVAPPQQQRVEYQQVVPPAASHDDGSRHIGGRAPAGIAQTAHVQGLLAVKSSQRLQRLREAYKLTELIGRPRAYDI